MTTDRTITASVGSELPEVGYAAAIAELPKLNHHRLRWLLGLEPEPSAVWTRIVQGHLPLMRSLPGGTMRAWVRAARAISPASTLARYQAAGVRVLVRGREGYPQRLLHDPEPPAVLFSLGNL
ncbi:MAG TPA: hypothetical protein VGR90_03315, partial [Acidimicrobiales bacterium]|nr:hypothetical protein [Acidimicrobiales bacterium]